MYNNILKYKQAVETFNCDENKIIQDNKNNIKTIIATSVINDDEVVDTKPKKISKDLDDIQRDIYKFANI